MRLCSKSSRFFNLPASLSDILPTGVLVFWLITSSTRPTSTIDSLRDLASAIRSSKRIIDFSGCWRSVINLFDLWAISKIAANVVAVLSR